jgi:ATP-dependent exoDNAse (exonuclease V) beta subunit
VANALCSRLFSRGDYPRGIQPAYEPLTAHLESGSDGPPVEVVRVELPGPKVAKGECARAEIGLVITRLRGLHGQFAWREMVVLVPTRTGIDELHGALHEAGIPAVFSGGRSFYARQEVLDTVHLLASLADPRDKGALVAFLGSPAGGVDNDDLVALCAAGLCGDFTYLDVAAIDPPDAHPGLGSLAPDQRRRVAGVLKELARLHRCVRECETWRAFQDLRQALPVVEAWAFSRFGRQRMANVDKLLDEVEARVRAGSSLATVVREMAEQELVEREGEESALASPMLDAVTIETIHGAKGLEFPAVILANLLREIRGENEKDVYVARDWTSGMIAARVGPLRNQAARAYHLSRQRKREAEIARLLYVALTRAKDRLVLFLHPSVSGTTYSSVLLEALDDALAGGELVEGRELTIAAGEDAGEREARPAACRLPAPLDDIVRHIGQRREARAALEAAPARLTPSSGDEANTRRELPAEESEAYPESRDRALRFGDLCHAVLQHLDLAEPLEDMDSALASPLACRIAGELHGELVGEAREVLTAAVQAPFFREVILRADRVMRELAVLEEVAGATLSGRIDLAARTGDSWVVVDFKTDREIAPREELIARYGGQKNAYTRVMRRALALPEDPRFFLYFLRHCEAVEL